MHFNQDLSLLYLNQRGVEADHAMLQLQSKNFSNVDFISRRSEAIKIIRNKKFNAVLVDVNFHIEKSCDLELYELLSTRFMLPMVITASLSDTLDLEQLDTLERVELLIKPFSATLLEKCLHLVIQEPTKSKNANKTISNRDNNQGKIESVFFRNSKRALERVDFDKVLFFQANGVLTNVHFISGVKRSVDSGLGSTLKKFNRSDLFQVHKSYAVPFHSIQKVYREAVELKDGSKIPLGRAYRENFKRALQAN